MVTNRTESVKPTVVFVSQPFDLVYPPEVDSSVPLQTVNLARQLVTHGFQVTVYAPRKNAAVLRQVVDGVNYYYISERGSGFLNRLFARVLTLLPRRRVPFHASVLSEVRYTLEIAIRIRAQKAEIVHVNSFTNFMPVLRLLNPAARFALHMHSEWVAQMDSTVMKRRVAMADLLISCSTHFANTISKVFPEAESRVRVVFNGVDTDFFSPASQPSRTDAADFRLLFVGRVSPEKGVHDLLDAFTKLTDAFPAARLDIVGPDASAPRGYIVDVSDDPLVRELAHYYDVAERDGISYLNQLKKRLPAWVAARVRFHGGAERHEVLDYYRSADILINPSLSEMFGGTVAEAMACGTAVVATRVGGMKDTVRDGETGFLVEPGRPDELARAIGRLLADRELRRSMGQRGRERALALVSWKTLGAQLASAYESLPPRS